MNSGDFFLLLYGNLWLYFLSLVISFFSFFVFYKRYFISIWDPILVSLVFSAFACATPIFLFMLGKISWFYFLVFLSTQLAFLVGLLVCKPLNPRVENSTIYKLEHEQLAFKIFFILVFFIHLILQLYIYKENGIPVFMFSKLEIYGAADILQFENRIVTILYPFLSFCAVYFLFTKKSFGFRIFTWIAIIWVIINGILSASRGFFLIIGESIFILLIFYDTLETKFTFIKFRMLERKMILWSIVFALLVIMVQFSDGSNPFYVLAYRLAASGDSYYMSLPNGVIDQMDHGHGLISIFSSPLKMFGLIKDSQMPESIGYQLVHYYTPGLDFTGPNSRHTLIGYLYLGLGGAIVFSFTLGFVASFVRNMLYYVCRKNKLTVLLYLGLLIFVSKFEMDYFTAQSYFINFLLFIIPLLVTAIFLAELLKFKPLAKPDNQKHLIET